MEPCDVAEVVAAGERRGDCRDPGGEHSAQEGGAAGQSRHRSPRDGRKRRQRGSVPNLAPGCPFRFTQRQLAAHDLLAAARGPTPRRLDLFQRAASRLGHGGDDPDQTDYAERREQPERVRLADCVDQRQEECADEERRAPVDRGRHRHRTSTNLVWIDLVDDGPCDRAGRERERDDENDERDERNPARRGSRGCPPSPIAKTRSRPRQG